jgi:hypothetical protein
VGVSGIFSICKISFLGVVVTSLPLSDYISVSWDTGPACGEAWGEEELRHLGGGGGGDGGRGVGGGGWDEWLGRGG